MICTKCGKEIADDSIFCDYCGTKIENNYNTEHKKQSSGTFYTKIKDFFFAHKILVITTSITIAIILMLIIKLLLPTLFTQIATSELNKRNYNVAIQWCDRAVQLNSNYAEAYFNRANIYETLQKYKEAHEDLNKAIEIKPQNALYYSTRGSIRTKLADYNGALNDYNSAIKIEPDNYIFYMQRSALKATQKKFKDAITDLDKAIEINSFTPALYICRCKLKIIINDTMGALKDANTVIDIANNDEDKAEGYHLRGQVKYKTRNYGGATDDFLEAYTLVPKQEYFQDYMNSTYNSVMSSIRSFYY